MPGIDEGVRYWKESPAAKKILRRTKRKVELIIVEIVTISEHTRRELVLSHLLNELCDAVFSTFNKIFISVIGTAFSEFSDSYSS